MAAQAFSTNVVRLPTAAPRQVRQNYNRSTRAARKELPQLQVQYMSPWQRRAMTTAQAVEDMPRTTEMELLSAICRALDPDTMKKVVDVLLPRAAAGLSIARQALTAVDIAQMTWVEQFDLLRAAKRLEDC